MRIGSPDLVLRDTFPAGQRPTRAGFYLSHKREPYFGVNGTPEPAKDRKILGGWWRPGKPGYWWMNRWHFDRYEPAEPIQSVEITSDAAGVHITVCGARFHMDQIVEPLEICYPENLVIDSLALSYDRASPFGLCVRYPRQFSLKGLAVSFDDPEPWKDGEVGGGYSALVIGAHDAELSDLLFYGGQIGLSLVGSTNCLVEGILADSLTIFAADQHGGACVGNYFRAVSGKVKVGNPSWRWSVAPATDCAVELVDEPLMVDPRQLS